MANAEDRIRALGEEFQRKEKALVVNEGDWGSDRWARIEDERARKKRMDMLRKEADREIYLNNRQGSTYEAQSQAGTAKSAADRERHMKLVLGDDWKPSDEGYLSRQKILNKMGKRNRALDPKNDPGFLSALRNKLDINPTNAEVERRLMTRGNASREESRLSEGEAAGAVAGSAAERIREARKVREATQRDEDFQRKRHEGYQKFRSGRGALEVAREPTVGGLEGLGTESLRERVNKDARVKDYKDFSDESALIRRERAMSGEGGITEAEGSEQALKEALPFARAAERKKYGEVGSKMLEERHQREKGLMNMGSLPPSERAKLESAEAGGERLDFDDPSIAGRGSWRGKEEELGGKSMPFTEAMKEKTGGKSLDLNEKENRELLSKIDPEKAASLEQGDIDKQMTEGMAKDEVERAVNEDFQGLPPIAQLDKGEQKEVLEEVAKASPDGKQSEEYLAAKEDTGDYIRYQDGKFVINKRAISQDFQKKERMDMLKDIPVANRAAMLASWGYIDSDDLTVAQKQSAKQIKEMSLLDLKIAKATSDAESAKGKLSAQDKTSYDAAHRGLLDALKSGDYSLADTYRKAINKIAPSSDTSSYSNLIEKRVKANKVMTPPKLFKKYGLKDGTAYYKSRESIVKSISLFDNGKGTSNDFAALMGQTVQAGDQKGKPITELMKNHGIYTWDQARGSTNLGIPPNVLKDEQSYMAWALPTIKKSLLTEIWGGLHRDIEKLALSNDSRGVRAEAAKFNGDDVAGGTSSPREEDKIAKDKANKPALEKAKKEANAKKVKTEKASVTKLASIKALNYQDKGVLSTRKQRVKETSNTIKKMEKELAEIKGSLNPSQIKTKQKRIDSFKNDLKKYEKLVIDKEIEAEAKYTNAEKIKGMKEYNKKRKAAGVPWLTKAEYIRLKEEGKL